MDEVSNGEVVRAQETAANSQYELPASIRRAQEIAVEHKRAWAERSSELKRLQPLVAFWSEIYCQKPNLHPGELPTEWLPAGWDSGVAIKLTREAWEKGLADGSWDRAWKQSFADRLAQFGRIASENGVTAHVSANIADAKRARCTLILGDWSRIELDEGQQLDIEIALDLVQASLRGDASHVRQLIEQCAPNVSWWWPFNGDHLRDALLSSRLNVSGGDETTTPCPACGGPRISADADRWCASCRSPIGKLVELWIETHEPRVPGGSYPSKGINSVPDRIVRSPEWMKVVHWSAILFKPGLRERFAEDPAETLAGWLHNMHGQTREEAFRTHLAAIADLLQREAQTSSNREKEGTFDLSLIDRGILRAMTMGDLGLTEEQLKRLKNTPELNDEPEFLFAPDGDAYSIRGFGEQGHVRKLKGCNIIWRLIQTPGKPASIYELDGAAKDNRLRGDRYSRQPTLDQEALREIWECLCHSRADLERAKSENNTVEAEHCQAEIDRLTITLKNSTAIAGVPRDLNNPIDKLRPKLSGALSRAINALMVAGMPHLAEHFHQGISSESGEFVYKPAGVAINWTTTKNH